MGRRLDMSTVPLSDHTAGGSSDYSVCDNHSAGFLANEFIIRDIHLLVKEILTSISAELDNGQVRTKPLTVL